MKKLHQECIKKKKKKGSEKPRPIAMNSLPAEKATRCQHSLFFASPEPLSAKRCVMFMKSAYL